MSHTLNLEITTNIDGGTSLAKAAAQVNDTAKQWSIQIAAGETAKEVEIDVDKADLSGLILAITDVPDATTPATLDCTVKVNSSGSPEQTFTCKPNNVGAWTANSPFPSPIASGVSATIASVFVANPNTVPVMFIMKLVADATP